MRFTTYMSIVYVFSDHGQSRTRSHDSWGTVRRYQRGNQKPEAQEVQIIHWSKEKDKRTNNGLQNTTHKATYWATQTPLKPGVNLGVPEGDAVPAQLVHPSCYSSYKPGDKSCMKKWPDGGYDNQNIYVIICDTDIT